MEINSNANVRELLPSTTSTNTGYEGGKIISEDSTFNDALNDAKDKLNKATSVTTLTDEELEQRNQDIRNASTELEAILIKMVLDAAQKTIPKDELFGDDNAMEIWRDMYNEKLANQMADAGGFGIADFIYEQLTRTNR